MTCANRLRAVKWMTTNSAVLRVFEQLALESGNRRRSFGVNDLRERYRWYCPNKTHDDEVFKFCNSHSPYVARWLLWRHPWLKPYLTCQATTDETKGEIELITEENICFGDSAGTGSRRA